MGFIKFNLFWFLMVSQIWAQTRFSPKSCLDSAYDMKMIHQGPFFGLLDQEFIINKKNCLIHVTHKKYFPKEWFVDVCREPVHIKVTSVTGGVDVAKKVALCQNFDKSQDTSDFCSQFYSLMDVIQDDGLIFAGGDRDDLTSDHGKTFCTYLLLKKYLNDSIIFSRYTEVPDIFSTDSKKSSMAPSILKQDVEVIRENQEAKIESASPDLFKEDVKF
jgi:hypothetical protein